MRKIGGLLVFIMYMVHLNALAHYSTSITLRRRSVRRVKAARHLLARSRIFFSESRMYEELLKIYLGFWRGRGAKPADDSYRERSALHFAVQGVAKI
jgi:hypothetical protein